MIGEPSCSVLGIPSTELFVVIQGRVFLQEERRSLELSCILPSAF